MGVFLYLVYMSIHGIIGSDNTMERNTIMTTFKEYASEHPTIQIDERLNDMEISDDVRELLELHTQFDENVVDEFEMGDCTYARAMYFDDDTVGYLANSTPGNPSRGTMCQCTHLTFFRLQRNLSR